MLYDSSLITVVTLAATVNVLGLALPLILYAFLMGSVREPYFRFWALNYLFMFMAIGGDIGLKPAGYPFVPSAAAYLLFGLGTAALVPVAYGLNGRVLRTNPLALVTGTVVAVAVGLLAAGVSFENASTPLVLFNVTAHLLVGTALIRKSRASAHGQLGTFIGVWTIVTGLWVLAFPVLAPLHLLWVGSIVAGINHFVIGVGMALFMLESTAAQLQANNEELRKLDRLKTDFVATVSHELRTPLTSIKASAWVLKNATAPLLDPTHQAFVTDLYEGTERLGTLIEDLLDFSQYELGQMTYDKQLADVAELVREVALGAKATYVAKGVEVEVSGDAEVEATVDAQRLRQVVSNLLSNAVKFTPAGGRIQLTVRKEGSQMRLEVKDTGEGVPADSLERIFTKFYQVEAAATRRHGGLGLGLAVCKTIVEEGHGGKIWAESPQRQGCTVVVLLPLTPPAQFPPALYFAPPAPEQA